MFTGLCYVCGVWCDATYCREHQELADTLAVPYRRERRRESHHPVLLKQAIYDLTACESIVHALHDENTQLADRLDHLERRLAAWRRVSHLKAA